ncbi:MAG: ABC transporter permease [Bacteroidota bacterium]|nr:ABC transporter permease [Bacteroidota bacterium]MDP4213070.1 ABC transporter permease [Bacteroidota bacterium]MDP4252127.1 ABC transporter permease [Bacteroidota bacterium]
MIKNYLLTAVRNMLRNKAFSVINILGLALGLACSLLIFLWVRDERSMDRFNSNTNRLYNVYERQYSGGRINVQYNTPGILADEMKRVLPEVQYASSFTNFKPENTFQVGDKILKENGGYAGRDFFNMFSYPLLAGRKATALGAPADMAISRKMATDFFGTPQQAMGKTIRFENSQDFRVSAVFENLPENASTQFDYLINWQSFLEKYPGLKSWGNTGVSTYVLLKNGVSPDVFAQTALHFLSRYNNYYNNSYREELITQRFDEKYLHSRYNSQGQPQGGRIEYVQLFSLVAIFILLIACINFMNLTTARSVKRAKEIGIRKTVGAFRSALILQFIGEAILTAFISMAIAMAIVTLFLPVFNEITQKHILLPVTDASVWPVLLLITLITGIIAGSYPALFLSSFQPAKVLKGTLKLKGANVIFRKGLVVFQFALSILLIVGTLVVSRQVNFIQTSNLGYDRENLIYIPQDGELSSKYSLLKLEAIRMPGIQSISCTAEEAPTNISSGTWGIDWEGKDPNLKPTFKDAGVGYDFTKTMNIRVQAGQDFSKDFPGDSNGYLLNEEAVKLIGYKNPVGRTFNLWGRKGPIVGVVKDFHFNSLQVAVDPMVMYLSKGDYNNGTILVRTQPGKTREALASLSSLCKAMNPEFPFTYKFSDEEFNKLYKAEQTAGSLSRYFAFLAIFISCLGLMGLAIFTAEQRSKEIGIRKVLGAGVISVFGLLSREFLYLVFIALLIASPMAWFSMNKWLEGYAYRTHISWWMFLLAGVLAFFIALATISFQTIKAALANPVRSLRSE